MRRSLAIYSRCPGPPEQLIHLDTVDFRPCFAREPVGEDLLFVEEAEEPGAAVEALFVSGNRLWIVGWVGNSTDVGWACKMNLLVEPSYEENQILAELRSVLDFHFFNEMVANDGVWFLPASEDWLGKGDIPLEVRGFLLDSGIPQTILTTDSRQDGSDLWDRWDRESEAAVSRWRGVARIALNGNL